VGLIGPRFGCDYCGGPLPERHLRVPRMLPLKPLRLDQPVDVDAPLIPDARVCSARCARLLDERERGTA